MTLTTAGMRVRREVVGLSRAWIAARLGVAEASVSRWESGARPTPQAVADLLDEAEERADILLGSVLVGLRRFLDDLDDEPDGVDVRAYPTDADLWAAHPGFRPWPASWHRAVLGRLRVELDPIPVRYTYEPVGLPVP